MASGTEKALWARLQATVRHHHGAQFTRIEATTALGVSDVEYVMSPRHGWIELKAATASGERKPLRLHEPLKATQAQWLMSHHNPTNNLHSFLLIGIVGPKEWREYLLLTAHASVSLLYQRLSPSYANLKRMPGVLHCTNMKAVVMALGTL